ncbi:MAG: GspE/PulE family protein [Maricaulaceae bacterium]|jgi:general secretion pathway protein E
MRRSDVRIEEEGAVDRAASYEETLAWLRDRAGLDPAAEAAARRTLRPGGEPLPLILNRMGAVGDGDLQAAFAAVSGAPIAEVGAIEPRGDVSAAFLRAHRALILGMADDAVSLGLVDPFDLDAAAGVAFALGRPVEVSVIRAGEQRRAHSSAYEDREAAWSVEVAERDETRIEAAFEFDRDAPVARRLAGWLAAAVERRASDVHIEPRSHALIVRYRIDGELETIAEEPLAAAASIVARIKVLADLDLGERRAPQDGRTTIVVAGRPVDLRVSVVPSVHGESAVMRILDRGEVRLDFETLGFSPTELSLLGKACRWPHGLFVVTGPTGSGKTTTLYAGLEAMRERDRKILTIEDPVEFYFDHVTQVQAAPKAGVTFPSAIRAFLRQDPDVIMVGEIRDGETARAAVQAALTGHLVLASLHAIDAPRAVPRLLDMGVEPFQLAACFRGALAQRLVRRLCAHCRREREPSGLETETLGLSAGERVWDAVGCPRCGGSGYQGRLAVAEGFAASDAFLADLRDGRAIAQSAAQALPHRLANDGAAKIRAGLTSPAEIMRAMSG